MAKDKQKAQSEQSGLQMATLPDLCDLLRGSKSPVPTSELATSLQPKAGPSRASQVFFRPPTPPVTPLQVKEILLASKWKDVIHLYQGAMPRLVRNSRKSDTCTVFFDIYNS
jgi:hypothetical protein